MYPRFTSVDSNHVWMLIRGYINQLCGQTPTDLRMGAFVPTTNFACLHVTLTETKRKASINYKSQYGPEPRELEDLLESQPQRFVSLRITVDSYDAMLWITSQFSGPLNSWRQKCKQYADLPANVDLHVEELRKTPCYPTFRMTQLMLC
jgi:hypothetical protein